MFSMLKLGLSTIFMELSKCFIICVNKYVFPTPNSPLMHIMDFFDSVCAIFDANMIVSFFDSK